MDGYITIGTKLDTKSFDRQIASLESKLNDVEATLQMASEDKTLFSTSEIQDMEREAEKLKNQLVDLYRKANVQNVSSFSKMKDAVEGINRSAQKVGKSVLRWGLALIGVRSAMTLIRGSMSTLSQYDEQLAKDMEYIRYVLAMTLKPVIETIVNLIFTALQYVNYLAQAWFGVNLFANASAESMENTTKNIKKSQKEMAKLNKEMFGFDKINKLSKDKSSDTGGGVPRVDLSKTLGDGDVPEWLRWLKENGPSLISIISGITGALVMLKLGFSGLQALGIGMVIMGIIELVQDLSSYLDKLNSSLDNNGTSWKDFGQIVMDIGIIIAGIGIAIGSIPVIVAGVTAMILGLILYFYEDINGIFQKIETTMWNVIEWIRSKVGFLADGVIRIVEGIFYTIWDLFQGFYGPLKNFFDGILLIFKGDFVGGIKNIFTGMLNFLIGKLNLLIDGLNIILTPILEAISIVSGFLSGDTQNRPYIKIPRISYLSTGAIINLPGKGVPVGLNTRGGEAGQEGILPLSDETAMERMGEKIGKYVSVNIDLTTTLDGRILSRQLKRVNNEDTFARNGG